MIGAGARPRTRWGVAGSAMPPPGAPADAGASTAFYDRLAADYHLVYADWDAAIAAQSGVLDRVIRGATAASAESLLDCACGIGTQALGLAACGYGVTASDLSPVAIGRARAEAAARGLKVRFLVADMRRLEQAVPGRFEVVLAADNALPHLLSAADLMRALGSIAARLRPGGVFVASIRDYDEALARRPDAVAPRFIDEGDGRRRIVHQVWEWLDERRYRVHIHITRELERGWQCRHHVGLYRALPRAEVTAALEAAGLVAVRWLMPGESGFHQPIVTAVRPADGAEEPGGGHARTARPGTVPAPGREPARGCCCAAPLL